MTNPLLERHPLPPFSRIKPSHAEPAVRSLIERNKQKIEALLAATDEYNWENLLSPIEEMEDELDQAWSSVSHLNSVCNSDTWRDAYNACLPLLSGYRTWRDQHEVLCRAYQYIADSAGFATLDAARRKAVEDGLRDFRLAGVFLPPAQKERYAEVRSRLSQLASKFGENVLDATTAWSKEVTREQLDGLPESALANARQAAEQRGRPGYLINLEYPSCMPVLTYCHDRELRREVYTAYCTRASDQGPHAGKWDNSGIIDETLALRHELAQLLGFDNYAEFSLATKMAESTAQVMAFLRQLAEQCQAPGEEEWGR
ncbi:MAG: M3 family metallopeptidase [Halioglobus sp.]|nr:M3 family metallopeptidase [Halioglobus sp.]